MVKQVNSKVQDKTNQLPLDLKVEPAASKKSATPVKPTAPAKNAAPAKPAEAAKPTAPAKPAKPAESAEPAKLAQPAQPAKPAATAAQTKPAVQTKPAAPAQPAPRKRPLPKPVQGIIFADSAKGNMVETAEEETEKTATPEYKRYYAAKIMAKTLEDENDSQLIFFPSNTGGKDREWYKAGGRSALFYKHIIGPRLKKKPVIRHDSDMRNRFKGGVVSVHFIDALLEELAAIGMKQHQENEMGLVMVEMGRQYTDAEIKELVNREQDDYAQFNKMVRPKDEYPDMYHLIISTIKLLPAKVRRMPTDYRQVFGRNLLVNMLKIETTYIKFANGDIDRKVAGQTILLHIDEMMGTIVILIENQIWEIPACVRIGGLLTDLRSLVSKRLSS